MRIGDLDTKVTIERKVSTTDPDYGTQTVTWQTLASVWAQVQDMLPSRDESIRGGREVSRNQKRVRIWHRTDVDSTMRIRVNETDDVLQIVGGPAVLGRKEYLEMVCEKLS